jgi:hypothetical protein
MSAKGITVAIHRADGVRIDRRRKNRVGSNDMSLDPIQTNLIGGGKGMPTEADGVVGTGEENPQ